MKLYTYSLTLSALALVLAAPGMASAKTTTHAPVHAAVVKPVAKTIDKTTTGKVYTTANGLGTYTTTVTGTAKDKKIVTTETFADGVTATFDTTDITAKNGTLYVDRQADVNGKISTTDEKFVATKTAGDYTITGVETQANGQRDQISGTKDATKSGAQTDLTLKAGSKTETLDTQTVVAGNASVSQTEGTSFNGKAINSLSVVVSNNLPKTNDVTTTADGKGTFTATSATNGSSTTSTTDRTFADGTTTSNVVTKTINQNGSATYDSDNTYNPTSGTPSSSQAIETYASTGNGNASISGSFSQSNNENGTLTGTKTAESYGSNTDLTYTNQNGKTKTADTQQLIIGNATVNINTGTTFSGQANDSIGVIASK